jgi:monoterpene epsilon-lactone hydrolase
MTNQESLTDASAQENTWHIGPRTLPPPAGASDTMRDSIADTPQPDPAVMQIDPQNEAEWFAVIEQMDAEKAEAVHALREQLSVSVEQDKIEGISVYHVAPAEVDPRHEDHLFVYVHGGAFVLNAGEAGLSEPILLAHRSKMRVLAIDYRMPPRYPAPAGRDDAVTVYQHLLKGHAASSIAFGGTSGGGNLAMATVQRLIELGLDVPGALYLGTPGTDMSKTGDSWYANDGIDRILATYDGFVEAASRLYAGGRDLKDPLVSPHYGDVDGFPPTLLVTGTRDLLLSNTARTHIKLREAGVLADILVYDGTSHGDYIFVVDSPESLHAYAELNAFLLQHLQ